MPAEIVGIDDEVRSVRTYHLRLSDSGDAASYRLRAGQFNMLYLPGIGEAAISVSGDPSDCHELVHTVRAVGNVTNRLALSTVGTTLGVRGPYGSHWPLEQCSGCDVVLIAGGIGLAPLRPVIYELLAKRERFGRIWLLMGARSPSDLLYATQYMNWSYEGITVQTTVDRPTDDWSGNVGVVTPLVERLELDRPNQTVVMTCGPEIMMRFAARSAQRIGVSTDHIWVSLERNMTCAFGHCGHCQFGPHFICKDGPVLRYDRVAALLEVRSL
ncbi:Anaerobic sulfite reductase subunit B [Stieleria varia]|uniref:Anaerobic sulfite reductase subunit B n=2 Tax=Stieleria varia TaxID=2528005 RepID=A0A5C5ZW75_9BACT|nr:Anaerobic sulfite reductase subunit B [Stieleria varia]